MFTLYLLNLFRCGCHFISATTTDTSSNWTNVLFVTNKITFQSTDVYMCFKCNQFSKDLTKYREKSWGKFFIYRELSTYKLISR